MEERRKPSSFTRHSTGAPLAFTTNLEERHRGGKDRGRGDKGKRRRITEVSHDFHDIFLNGDNSQLISQLLCCRFTKSNGWYQRKYIEFSKCSAHLFSTSSEHLIHLSRHPKKHKNVNKTSLKHEWTNPLYTFFTSSYPYFHIFTFFFFFKYHSSFSTHGGCTDTLSHVWTQDW